jgi:hypothetical protein
LVIIIETTAGFDFLTAATIGSSIADSVFPGAGCPIKYDPILDLLAITIPKTTTMTIRLVMALSTIVLTAALLNSIL